MLWTPRSGWSGEQGRSIREECDEEEQHSRPRYHSSSSSSCSTGHSPIQGGEGGTYSWASPISSSYASLGVGQAPFLHTAATASSSSYPTPSPTPSPSSMAQGGAPTPAFVFPTFTDAFASSGSSSPLPTPSPTSLGPPGSYVNEIDPFFEPSAVTVDPFARRMPALSLGSGGGGTGGSRHQQHRHERASSDRSVSLPSLATQTSATPAPGPSRPPLADGSSSSSSSSSSSPSSSPSSMLMRQPSAIQVAKQPLRPRLFSASTTAGSRTTSPRTSMSMTPSPTSSVFSPPPLVQRPSKSSSRPTAPDPSVTRVTRERSASTTSSIASSTHQRHHQHQFSASSVVTSSFSSPKGRHSQLPPAPPPPTRALPLPPAHPPAPSLELDDVWAGFCTAASSSCVSPNPALEEDNSYASDLDNSRAPTYLRPCPSPPPFSPKSFSLRSSPHLDFNFPPSDSFRSLASLDLPTFLPAFPAPPSHAPPPRHRRTQHERRESVSTEASANSPGPTTPGFAQESMSMVLVKGVAALEFGDGWPEQQEVGGEAWGEVEEGPTSSGVWSWGEAL